MEEEQQDNPDGFAELPGNEPGNSQDGNFEHFQSSEDSAATETGDSLYLNQLEYTEKAGKTWLNFFIKNFRVTALIVIGFLTWGIISYNLLPIESQPEVEIPYGRVSVALPGASPADVEELILEKLEPRIANVSGVKTMQSSALNSLAIVSVEFYAGEDLDAAIRALRDTVETIKSELPEDASDPIVSEVSFSDSPIWTLVVTGPYDNFALRTYAEMVQDEIEKIPGTSRVTISGGDTYEIRVSYNPQALASYGITMDQANAAIRGANFSLPLGTLAISDYDYSVRTEGKFLNAAELRTIPIPVSGGASIRLQDVAVVVERAAERSSHTRFSLEGEKPHNAVTLNVVKKTGTSIIDLIDEGKARIEALQKTSLPSELHVATTLDFAEEIRHDFSDLIQHGILTVFLVTLVLFLFVGIKEAFVAGLAIPLVFAITFGVMNMVGISLNFLSIFSLILSLGILVDDAIVVVQATKQYLKTGKFTPEEAVLLVFQDFKILLTTTTLTTIWAFIPLLLATGIIGQFIKSIPITVSVTLAASYFVAIIVNHPMAIILERFRITRAVVKPFLWLFFLLFAGSLLSFIFGGAGALIPLIIFAVLFFVLLLWYRKSLREKLLRNEQRVLEELADPEKIRAKIRHHYSDDNTNRSLFTRLTTGIIKMDKLLPTYGRILTGLVKSRVKSWVFLLVALLLFIGAFMLPASGTLKSEFLPPADSTYMYVNIQGPPGLLAERTREIADQVEEILLKEPTIENFSVVTASSGVNISSGVLATSGSGGQSNRAQFAINLYPFSERPATGPEGKVEKSYDIASRLRKAVEPLEGARIDVQELAGGPPTGSDIEGQITGENMAILEREANRYRDILAEIPGTVNETTSLTLSPGEFTFRLKHDQMAEHSISAAQIASTLRTALSGTEVTKILRDGDEISVQAEFDSRFIPTLDALRNLQLVNTRGQLFRLGDVAEVTADAAVTGIQRIDQKRVLFVSASVESPYLPADVLAEFQKKIAENPLPSGYEISFGGQNETNAESVLSILWAMLVAMILILGTLVVQFNSFRKPILVLATIPLALTGVFTGLTLIGFTLSFPSLIGILALFGIVVKNAVMLVDKMNLNLRVGIPYTDAIVDASKSRLEAIFLTSVCTIIGMAPITFANETWEGLGAALIFGLTASTLLTLFVIPILFHMIFRKEHERATELLALKENVRG